MDLYSSYSSSKNLVRPPYFFPSEVSIPFLFFNFFAFVFLYLQILHLSSYCCSASTTPTSVPSLLLLLLLLLTFWCSATSTYNIPNAYLILTYCSASSAWCSASSTLKAISLVWRWLGTRDPSIQSWVTYPLCHPCRWQERFEVDIIFIQSLEIKILTLRGVEPTTLCSRVEWPFHSAILAADRRGLKLISFLIRV